jgi:tRNA-2-methylthio-N6-dimethylallyladenosine synthase
VPDTVKAQRWHILNTVLEENVKKRSQLMVGREEEVLINGIRDEQFFGRTRNFKEVFFPVKEGVNIGDRVNVKIL